MTMPLSQQIFDALSQYRTQIDHLAEHAKKTSEQTRLVETMNLDTKKSLAGKDLQATGEELATFHLSCRDAHEVALEIFHSLQTVDQAVSADYPELERIRDRAKGFSEADIAKRVSLLQDISTSLQSLLQTTQKVAETLFSRRKELGAAEKTIFPEIKKQSHTGLSDTLWYGINCIVRPLQNFPLDDAIEQIKQKRANRTSFQAENEQLKEASQYLEQQANTPEGELKKLFYLEDYLSHLSNEQEINRINALMTPTPAEVGAADDSKEEKVSSVEANALSSAEPLSTAELSESIVATQETAPSAESTPKAVAAAKPAAPKQAQPVAPQRESEGQPAKSANSKKAPTRPPLVSSGSVSTRRK